MLPKDRANLEASANSLGITPEALAVRLAKKAGAGHRVIVRSRGGGLRIVQPGDKLNLADDEFIAALPIGTIRSAQREVKRLGTVRSADLED